ncbi:unnamed protein product [Phyllotreta striolata]|uniref:THAP-type domain-containing protein n=1 Tax=Phyllotreta striolata TaxID=444603 RepID=A0A9P0GT94_PHYSR|nr:unnamed protein product [Phyllotreta striolata]
MKVYTRGSGTCAAVYCWNNYKNCKYGFYRFPANVTRAKLWAIATGREDLCSTTDSLKSLHKTHRICSSHFKSCMVIGGSRKRLVHHAIPTIFPTKPSNFHLSDHNYYRPVREINIDELLCQINEKDNNDIDEILKINEVNKSPVIKNEEAETDITNVNLEQEAKIKLEPEELFLNQEEILIKDEPFDEHIDTIKKETFSDNEEVDKMKIQKNDSDVKKYKHLEESSMAKIKEELLSNQEEISIKDESLDEHTLHIKDEPLDEHTLHIKDEPLDEHTLHIKDEPTDSPEEDDSYCINARMQKLSSNYRVKPPIAQCGICNRRSAHLRYKINNHFRLLFHGDSD